MKNKERIGISNKVLLILNVVVLAISGTVSVFATSYLYNAKDVSYSNTTSGISSSNVQGAIDKLYAAASDYSSIREMIYPVGSIYISVTDDTVAKVQNRFGGTWVSFGSGRTLVGVNSSDSNFNTIEKTGGSSTHYHHLPIFRAGLSSNPADNQVLFNWNGPQYNDYGSRVTIKESSWGSFTLNGNAGNKTGYPMSSETVSSLQPYITVYMYKRTA